jgi:hypothetical protein
MPTALHSTTIQLSTASLGRITVKREGVAIRPGDEARAQPTKTLIYLISNHGMSRCPFFNRRFPGRVSGFRQAEDFFSERDGMPTWQAAGRLVGGGQKVLAAGVGDGCRCHCRCITLR